MGGEVRLLKRVFNEEEAARFIRNEFKKNDKDYPINEILAVLQYEYEYMKREGFIKEKKKLAMGIWNKLRGRSFK